MSGTRSPSPREPATETRRLLIVAHGSPSQPDGPEAVMRALAAEVEALAEGWRVRGATLAAKGALAASVADLGGAALLVYPHFMSDGWFVSEELPRRLGLAGSPEAEILPPFGRDARIAGLCERRVREAADERGWAPAETTLLLAAHGSPSDPRPAEATEAVAAEIRATQRFRELRTGYVDQAPFLAEAARIDGLAICLPFFAGRAGHVETDLPEALAEAAFSGPMLEPIGADREAPALIAAALAARADRRAA